jgi:hypothetical protein
MPRPGLKVAQRLIVHLIHFGKELDDLVVRVAMIDEDIMTDAVPAGPQMSVRLCRARTSQAFWRWPQSFS